MDNDNLKDISQLNEHEKEEARKRMDRLEKAIKKYEGFSREFTATLDRIEKISDESHEKLENIVKKMTEISDKLNENNEEDE